MKKLKLLDTFAGIGGFSYAAEKLVGGFQTVQFIEIDPYCQQVLNKNFPNIPIHDDITTYRAEPHSADIITGRFPCQSISHHGDFEVWSLVSTHQNHTHGTTKILHLGKRISDPC